MKLTCRLLVATAIMLLGSFTTKATNGICSFTYSPAYGWVLPPGYPPTSPSTDACQATITVTYTATSISTGAITAYSLSHTYSMNETYAFGLVIPIGTVLGNVNYTFTVPCMAGVYGPISQAAATGSYQPYENLGVSGDAELVMLYTPGGGFTLPHYTFSFEPPVGIGG